MRRGVVSVEMWKGGEFDGLTEMQILLYRLQAKDSRRRIVCSSSCRRS